MYNKVVLVGNLTRDIELRYLPSGSAVAKSAVATSHKYKSQTGEQKEEVMFLDFNIFGRSAEVANQYLRKGSKVLLEGRLVFEQWTAQDGTNRSKHSLRVETMKMLDSKDSGERQQSYTPDYQPAPGYERRQSPQHTDGMNQQPSMNQSIPEIDIDDKIPFKEDTTPIHKVVKFYVQCISCETIFDTDKYDLDLEDDGDICGFCSNCKSPRIFYEVTKDGKHIER